MTLSGFSWYDPTVVCNFSEQCVTHMKEHMAHGDRYRARRNSIVVHQQGYITQEKGCIACYEWYIVYKEEIMAYQGDYYRTLKEW